MKIPRRLKIVAAAVLAGYAAVCIGIGVAVGALAL